MLKILIIEDEEPAAKRLFKLIREIDPDTELLASLPSISDSLAWFGQNPPPDLIFSDIQLSDGLCFEIFRQKDPGCPIIFTTAYDQYAVEAFRLNSIHYLLKPIKKAELEEAIEKFKKNRQATTPVVTDLGKLLEMLDGQSSKIKKRFIVKYGDHIKTIAADEVAYFFTEDKVNFLTTHEGRRFVIDLNLDQLESMLDPEMFFRINRQYIISISSISEMLTHTKSRVLVKLKPATKEETLVSSERSASFKVWLGDH
jgi:DNA-binding LytR/AlgR family response regulator